MVFGCPLPCASGFDRVLVYLLQLRDGSDGQPQIAETAIFHTVDPAVNGELLTSLPRCAHDGCITHILNLLDDIDFAKSTKPILEVTDLTKLGAMHPVDVLQVQQPVIDEPELARFHGGTNAAAAVVTADDNVAYTQDVHRVLHDGKAIQIRMDDLVRDVTVDEQLTGQQADDLIRRDAAVRTSDPQMLRILLLSKLFEEIRLFLPDSLRPLTVAIEEIP